MAALLPVMVNFCRTTQISKLAGVLAELHFIWSAVIGVETYHVKIRDHTHNSYK